MQGAASAKPEDAEQCKPGRRAGRRRSVLSQVLPVEFRLDPVDGSPHCYLRG